MYHLRTTKTASGATAVQVVRYHNRKMIIEVHIGSAHNKEELLTLKQVATCWIEKATKQIRLFSLDKQKTSSLVVLDKCQHLGIRYSFIYEVLFKILTLFKFHLLNNKLLTDLVIIRLIEPASKLRSLELLEELFGIKHSRRDWYRRLPDIVGLKEKVEFQVISLAKKEFRFDFCLVFYDVTSLYFETFKTDKLRKPGFSKDNKQNQPQVLIGLMVTKDGFPIIYDIFEGNKFEGHTLIPIILSLKHKYHIDKLTVVADAAMLSKDIITTLESNNLNYIVGARMGNLPISLSKSISKELNQTDGAIRIQTNPRTLICDFSTRRYRKDKSEMEKQLIKTGEYLRNPFKLKKTKFLQSKGNYEVNVDLIEKTKNLLGITNLNTDPTAIIKQYHNLWHVEQVFRMAKNDLEIRPIYHFKKQAIKAHILICFMALAIGKYLEIKTGKSLKNIIKSLKSITDVRILNTKTFEELVMRSFISDEVKYILLNLGLSY